MADKKKTRDGKAGAERPSADATATVALPIEWHFPEGLIGRYANQMLVQHGPHETSVCFFDAQAPLLLGSPEEMREQVKNIKSIRAECVARIIVAKDFLPLLIRVLQESLEKLEAKSASQAESASRTADSDQG